VETVIVTYYLDQNRDNFLEFLNRGQFTVLTEVPLKVDGEIIFRRFSNLPPSDDRFGVLASNLPDYDEECAVLDWEKLIVRPNLEIDLGSFKGIQVHSSGKTAEDYRVPPVFKNFINILNDAKLDEEGKF